MSHAGRMQTLGVLNGTVERLSVMLIDAQIRVQRYELLGDMAALPKVHAEIKSIDRRMRLAERLQDEAQR